MAKRIRRHLYFSGEVQAVGFRYRARKICDYLGLTGWCRNCADGRVEMEVQGTPETIERMIQMLNQQQWIRIARVDGSTIPLEEHETTFQIIV